MKDDKGFVTLKRFSSIQAQYYILYGERSNGKTTAVLDEACLTDAWNTLYEERTREFVIIRRFGVDIVGNRVNDFFKSINSRGVVKKLTKGEYDRVIVEKKTFYFYSSETETKSKPIGYVIALTDMEHDKGRNFPDVKNVLFDEFITHTYYLPNEFELFTNTLSTIVRLEDDVKIYMCGNTVNRYSLYFREMQLKGIKKQKQGTIDVYNIQDAHDAKIKTTIAVYYTDSLAKGAKKSNIYFAFNSPKVNMIKNGAWEVGMYPHLPIRYMESQIIFNYFIRFDDDIFHCEIIKTPKGAFTYIHEKTTPIRNDNDIVFDLNVYDLSPYHNRNMLRCEKPFVSKLLYFFDNDLVFYQDNLVGNAIDNYFKQCRRGA